MNSEKKEIPYELKLHVSLYKNFLESMKSISSPTRYMAELTYIDNIKNIAEKHNLEAYIEKCKEMNTKIKEKLEKDYGIQL